MKSSKTWPVIRPITRGERTFGRYLPCPRDSRQPLLPSLSSAVHFHFSGLVNSKSPMEAGLSKRCE